MQQSCVAARFGVAARTSLAPKDEAISATASGPEPGASVRLVPIVRAFIADTVTPIAAYLALRRPGRSCLLESVEGTDRIARYSFIGLDYLAALTIERDPAMLQRLRALLASFSVDRDAPELAAVPFPGGAVCTFGYDAARVLERIGDSPAPDVPRPDCEAVVPGTWVVFDHFTHRVTLVGFATPDIAREDVEARLDRYVAALHDVRASVPGPVAACGPLSASFDQPAFLAAVARAKRAIYEGDVYQLQVGIRFSSELAGEPFDVYRHIRARNPSPYMFFIESGEHATFGASPEFLVRLDSGRARLRPLAGTRPRGETPDADLALSAELLANEKERAEHVMLVDLGRNDLGAVCSTGTVRVDELMVIERYSHVMHIVSNVTGDLAPEYDALDLFAAAFPAGTVTGAPKIRAMQLIDEIEPVARGFYAGSVAHIDFDGDMDSCIVLRSVATAGGRAYWQASAGIVADSEPEAEYAEIFAKTRIVREVLGVESPGVSGVRP